MNTTNANRELGFDKFSECNYSLHWSFSNFNRILMAAGLIARLPIGAKVLELGAGSSDLMRTVHENFRRDDIMFDRFDGDDRYKGCDDIIVADITSDRFCREMVSPGRYDCVVFMEVVEHLDECVVPDMFEKIAMWLVPEGLMIMTTPTPPHEAKYEYQVWPTDHKKEFTNKEIYGIINHRFKVVKQIGWSLEEREYMELLEENPALAITANKMRGAFPESYIRATIASLAPVEYCRQILMVCKKRRLPNGRFAQA